MVSKFKQYNGADEYRGQSTDVKPVANNGDVFHEIETGKDFMYNESAGEWDEAERADDNEAFYVKQVVEANELRNELYCDSDEEGDNA
jgi:hypothetical protein|nr:MAG TPA: hypothetical protein [Caudoviricetes sp.]